MDCLVNKKAYSWRFEVLFFLIDLSVFLYTVSLNLFSVDVVDCFFFYIFFICLFFDCFYLGEIEFTYVQVFKLFILCVINFFSNCYKVETIFVIFLLTYSLVYNIDSFRNLHTHFTYWNTKKHINKVDKFYFVICCFSLILYFVLHRNYIFSTLLFVFYDCFITFPVIYRQGFVDCNSVLFPKSVGEMKILNSISRNISPTFFVLPFLFPYLTNDITSMTVISALFLVTGLFIQELQFQRSNGLKFNDFYFYRYFLLKTLITVSVGMLFKFSPIITVNSEQNPIITVICAVFVFNFTGSFILLQENHDKFGSIKLLDYVIDYKKIIFIVIIPALFIMIYYFGWISFDYMAFYAFFSIFYSVGTSVYLIFSLKKVLNVKNIIFQLLYRTSRGEIFYYSTNQITDGDDKINTVLRLCTDSVQKRKLLIWMKFSLLFFGGLKATWMMYYQIRIYIQ